MTTKNNQDSGRLQKMRERYQALKEKLQTIDYILLGTIQQHHLERTLASGERKRYGPYYAWTFKLDGRTVTVSLTKEQARAYQKAISDHKKINRILQQMRTLSLKLLEASHPQVHRRKSRPFLPKPP